MHADTDQIRMADNSKESEDLVIEADLSKEDHAPEPKEAPEPEEATVVIS